MAGKRQLPLGEEHVRCSVYQKVLGVHVHFTAYVMILSYCLSNNTDIIA